MKLLSIAFMTLFSLTVLAQDPEDLVAEGVALHDQGNYNGAIAKYDEALALDDEFVLAIGEKAMTLNVIGRYREAIKLCLQAIDLEDDEGGLLKTIYLTLANSYDESGDDEEAIEAYDDAIKRFPDFYQFYYNKGVTLVGQEKYEESQACFEMAVQKNPYHTSSHLLLALLMLDDNNKVASLMSFTLFLTFENESTRSMNNFERFEYVQSMGASVKSKGNSININLNSFIPKDSTDTTITPNDFHSQELLLGLSGALYQTKEHKKKKDYEKFEMLLVTMISSFEENEDEVTGFYWEKYVPFFIALKKEGHLDVVSRLVYLSSKKNKKKALKWLQENYREYKAFLEWFEEYEWDEESEDSEVSDSEH